MLRGGSKWIQLECFNLIGIQEAPIQPSVHPNLRRLSVGSFLYRLTGSPETSATWGLSVPLKETDDEEIKVTKEQIKGILKGHRVGLGAKGLRSGDLPLPRRKSVPPKSSLLLQNLLSKERHQTATGPDFQRCNPRKHSKNCLDRIQGRNSYWSILNLVSWVYVWFTVEVAKLHVNHKSR